MVVLSHVSKSIRCSAALVYLRDSWDIKTGRNYGSFQNEVIEKLFLIYVPGLHCFWAPFNRNFRVVLR